MYSFKRIAMILLSRLISLSMRVSAFISLALVVVLVLHTVLYDIRLNMSILPSIYTDHSYTLNICTRLIKRTVSQNFRQFLLKKSSSTPYEQVKTVSCTFVCSRRFSRKTYVRVINDYVDKPLVILLLNKR